MKLIDLLNKIANGEVKEGTKIKIEGSEIEYKILNGDIVQANAFEIYFLIGRKRLNDEVEIIEKKPQGRWKPKEGEGYKTISDAGHIYYFYYYGDEADKWRYLNKNIFKTQPEAEDYLAYKKALLEAEKPFVKNEINLKLTFSTKDRRVFLSANYDEISQGAIYLGTNKNVAQAFVDKWHKQILKYEFGIEE